MAENKREKKTCKTASYGKARKTTFKSLRANCLETN